MRVLGIETSCDETGIAVFDAKEGLLAHVLHSQASHAAFGGVVPELASRDHVQKTLPLIQEVLAEANLAITEIEGIAYTAGPGLAGALLVGATIGQALGFALHIPTVAVHHMEGHLLAAMLEPNPPAYPFIALLVSGGHTQLIHVKAWGQYEILGDTLDDAVGEAFDKTAKLLGLGYPGGAHLAQLAEKGDSKRFCFPRPMLDRPGLDFSFSGLKTFAANIIAKKGNHPQDIAAAFQEAVVETLAEKCSRALQLTGISSLVVAGGVGANQALRMRLKVLMDTRGGQVFFPRPEFCTDNGAMIAYAGCQRLLKTHSNDHLAIRVYPRWSLSDL